MLCSRTLDRRVPEQSSGCTEVSPGTKLFGIGMLYRDLHHKSC